MRIELEKRLIRFAVDVILISRLLEKNEYPPKHLIDQVLRSSSAPALNFGEAQKAESRKDFIHKLSIVNKELKETQINLEILGGLPGIDEATNITEIIRECGELVAIFTKSIETAKRNLEKGRSDKR